MCGLSAIFAHSDARPLAGAIRRMTDLVRHRGPDGEGFMVWDESGRPYPFGGPDTPSDTYDAPLAARPSRTPPADRLPAVAALGHRRLSIVDLSSAGHQPMATPDGELVIVFNGEVYNHGEIRRELEALGTRFTSRTDTEVILHAYRQWGAACLQRFNGMFTIVIYAPATRRVFIARDRFGVKPCYLWVSPEGFTAIASEIKQFTGLPGWEARLDPQRAFDYLNYSLTDHSRHTMFAGVGQLRGGEFFEGTIQELPDHERRRRRWYDLTPGPAPRSAADAAEEFRYLFTDSVKLRLEADVPVGTALSGGLDSSSIVCVASQIRRESGTKAGQSTFSACAEDPRYDERQHIARVIAHTGVEPHYTFPQVHAFLDILPDVIWHQDEPFGGASIFAEWEVFRLVSQTPVRVTLDGHGADELLAGYHTFFGPMLAGLARRGRFGALRREAAALRSSHGYGWGYAATRLADAFLPPWMNGVARRLSGKVAPTADWMETGALGVVQEDLPARLGARAHSARDYSISQLLATSLPVQLHWCDRDSMAHSIESRTPFLDYRLVEFVLGCPDEMRIGGGTTKRLQREGMAGILPEEIRQRRDKMGFVTPEEQWVRVEERERFLGLTNQAVRRAEGILNDRARDRAHRIINGEGPFDWFVWRIILLSAWLDRFEVRVGR
jgi:asparagine synthase (glutamine-hydrolysing)